MMNSNSGGGVMNGGGGGEIIRPKAMKVTTIHPRMLQEFHEECAKLNIAETDRDYQHHQAQQWHSKWTLQQNQHHQYHQQLTSTQTRSPEDFRLGAKNPSLSDSSDCGNPADSTCSESPPPQPNNSTPLLRPVALRVSHTHNPPTNHVNPFMLPGPQHQHQLPQQPPSQMQLPTIAPPPTLMAPSPLHLPSAPASPLTLPSEVIYQYHADDEELYSLGDSTSTSQKIPSVIMQHPRSVLDAAKERVLHALAISGGDVQTKQFEQSLSHLAKFYEETEWDARDVHGIYSNSSSSTIGSFGHSHASAGTIPGVRKIEGMWLTLSKPTYFGNLGENPNGDPMYTLGRMAFDMFLPTQLICSLQGNFNPVRVVSPEERQHLLEKVPKSLQEEVVSGASVLRTYNIITAFTIEPNLADYPDAPNKAVRRPIKGIMTVNGYVLPDPSTPNRLSIWFTGGTIEPNDDPSDQREWHRFFGNQTQDGRTFGEKVRLLAVNLLLGAEAPTEMKEDGSMEFSFSRPLGGHGVAYVDVVYLDETLRIVRGHRGTILCFTRIPDQEEAVTATAPSAPINVVM